jgi:hypothetical protein
MTEQDQVHPVPEFDPTIQEQSLHTIWRPTTKAFQVIQNTFPHATPTQATRKHWMIYCLEQIINIDRHCLNFASKDALMCHVCRYTTLEQARLRQANHANQRICLWCLQQQEGFANVLGSRVTLDKLTEALFKASSFLLDNLCLLQRQLVTILLVCFPPLYPS